MVAAEKEGGGMTSPATEAFHDICAAGYLEDRYEYSLDMLEDMYDLTEDQARDLRGLIVAAMREGIK